VYLAISAAHASAAQGATDADAPRSDFSGRWVPDFERWQGVERLLDLQDAPWIVRQAIGRVNAVEAVTQTDDELVVELDVPLPLPGKVQRCPFDDRLRDDRTPLGRPSRSRHYWEDPRTLVHVHELADESGTLYTLTARRRLGVDGDTMVLEIVAAVPNQPDHHALQVYRRRPD
jgi:hypothetical protein